VGEGNPIRNCELAAYFTHSNLQPIHLVLSLRSAMNCAYKISNFKLSASFAKRLLELNPQSAIATQARKVVAFAEQNNTNKNEINYDERNPFVLCCSTFTPIYKGSAHVSCPFCAAPYLPQSAGKVFLYFILN
jgi:coatomer subunit alpha